MDDSQTKGMGNEFDETIDNDVVEEEVQGIPFGMFGVTFLTNILQYSLLVGLSMVILIIMRILMPESMLAP